MSQRRSSPFNVPITLTALLGASPGGCPDSAGWRRGDRRTRRCPCGGPPASHHPGRRPWPRIQGRQLWAVLRPGPEKIDVPASSPPEVSATSGRGPDPAGPAAGMPAGDVGTAYRHITGKSNSSAEALQRPPRGGDHQPAGQRKGRLAFCGGTEGKAALGSASRYEVWVPKRAGYGGNPAHDRTIPSRAVRSTAQACGRLGRNYASCLTTCVNHVSQMWTKFGSFRLRRLAAHAAHP